MANPAFHVDVVHTVTYCYNEHFTDEASVRELEESLKDTIKFRDPQYAHHYEHEVKVWVNGEASE